MEQAKPWYMSSVILSLVAGLILQVVAKTGYFPELTQDSIVATLIVVVPMIAGIVGRFTSKKQVTATKTAADNINASA